MAAADVGNMLGHIGKEVRKVSRDTSERTRLQRGRSGVDAVEESW